MGRPKKTESVAKNNATVAEATVAVIATENENVAVKEDTVKVNQTAVTPLVDSDEIQVVSLIPNVSYKDSRTNDFYEWDEVGHSEPMTFETLKNMWRNHKGYFKNMWLRPMDDRVIRHFGLTKMFEKYEFLMNESNYNRNNIQEICKMISESPNGLKYSLVIKAKDMVIGGRLADVNVIKALEKHLKIDLISSL